jgi:hypothetical protein
MTRLGGGDLAVNPELSCSRSATIPGRPGCGRDENLWVNSQAHDFPGSTPTGSHNGSSVNWHGGAPVGLGVAKVEILAK